MIDICIPNPVLEVIEYNRVVATERRIPDGPPVTDAEMDEAVRQANEVLALWEANLGLVGALMSWGALDCLRYVGAVANDRSETPRIAGTSTAARRLQRALDTAAPVVASMLASFIASRWNLTSVVETLESMRVASEGEAGQ